MLERFDKFFFIDDALIRKFGGEVRPFNFATDEIFRDKKQPNKNNKNNGNNKGNAGAGPRVEGMATNMSQQPPPSINIPTAGPMIQQQALPVAMNGGGYNNGGGGNLEQFVPEYAEPVAANGALGGGGWGSAW